MPEQDLSAVFAREYEKLDEIRNAGGFREFWAAYPQLRSAVEPARGMRDIVCIDGRIHRDGPLISIPGSLLGKPLEQSRRIIEAGNVGRLFSHGNGCGAAQLVMGREPDYQGVALDRQEVDRYADQNTRALAAELGVEYGGQLPAEGPHKEVCVYFTDLLDFNPRPYYETLLPEGFVVSAAVQPAEAALADLELALSIAFNPYGMGRLFTAERPLTILPVGTAAALRDHVARFVNGTDYADRISLDQGLAL